MANDNQLFHKLSLHTALSLLQNNNENDNDEDYELSSTSSESSDDFETILRLYTNDSLNETLQIQNTNNNFKYSNNNSRHFKSTNNQRKLKRSKIINNQLNKKLNQNKKQKINTNKKINVGHQDIEKEFVAHVIPLFDLDTFKKYFKMSKSSAQNIISIIELDYLESKEYKDSGSLHTEPSCREAVLMTIWFMVTSENLRSIGNRFDFQENKVHSIITKTTKLILKYQNKWLIWPTGEAAVENLNDFNSIPGNKLKGIFGVLGSNLFEIKEDTIQGETYNKIYLLCVCNRKLKFLYSYSGCPNLISEHKVFTKAALYNALKYNQSDYLPSSSYLISSSSYHLYKYNICNFNKKNIQNKFHLLFNYYLNKIKKLIKKSFFKLKVNIIRMNYLYDENVIDAVEYSILGCILHNIGIDDNIDWDIAVVKQGDEAESEEEKDDEEETDEHTDYDEEGIEMRNQILQNLLQNNIEI